MQRVKYIGQRLGYAAVTLLGISILLFTLVRIMPGGPAVALLGVSATPDQVESLNKLYGLDQPLVVQYFTYLSQLVQGDLGRSMIYRRPVTEVILTALPVTLSLAVYVLVLSAISTVILGVVSATRKGSTTDTLIRSVPLFGIGLPVFWIGAVLLYLLALVFPVFPAGGFKSGVGGSFWSFFLPALAISVSISAILIRSMRRALIDVLESDYVTTARAAGLRGARLMFGHIIFNAAIPTLTLFGVVFVALLGGAIVIEQVFALPGLGKLLIQAFTQRDTALVMGIVLITASIILVVNILLDLLYTIIDPRVTLS